MAVACPLRFRLAFAALMLALVPAVACAQSAPAPIAPAAAPLHYETLFFHVLDYAIVAVLVAASIAGIALAINAILTIREAKIIPPATIEKLRTMLANRQFRELMAFTAEDQTFVSQSLYAALRRAPHGYPAMHEAYETAAGEQAADQFRRIEFLNVIGNMGPLIGLLGTVLGMIISFYELGLAGGNDPPGALATGIAIALWHTFGGLAVAIPSLVVFGIYRTRIDRITNKAALLGEELLESCRPEPADTDAEPTPAAAGAG